MVLALLLALSGADTAAADTCTCPQVDTAKPTCFVPLSISQQAQQALQKLCKAAAATAGSKPPDLLHDMEAVAAIRQTLTRNLANASRAALEQYMHTTRRDAIAGIPVVFGVPKGIEQRKPADTQLIFYIHGERSWPGEVCTAHARGYSACTCNSWMCRHMRVHACTYMQTLPRMHPPCTCRTEARTTASQGTQPHAASPAALKTAKAPAPQPCSGLLACNMQAAAMLQALASHNGVPWHWWRPRQA